VNDDKLLYLHIYTGKDAMKNN